MVRMVTRLAHSRAGVTTREQLPQNSLQPAKEIKKWTLLPVNARVQYKHLTDKQPELLAAPKRVSTTSFDCRQIGHPGVRPG